MKGWTISRIASRCLAAAMLAAVAAGCPRRITTSAAPTIGSTGLYQDVALRSGIDFRHDPGARGQHYILETTGSGCAFFDYDADNLPDLLMLQAGPLPWERAVATEPRNRLYHNLGGGKFQDVTAGSGLEDTGFSQGVAVGDVNRDGFDDLFVTGYGGNHLLLNLGGRGTFRDVTASAGLQDPGKDRWATSAAFGDYNNDGALDLYVCRYARWNRKNNRPCKNPLGQSSYCSPELYAGDEGSLYRNNGRGIFADVTRAARMAGVPARGLGVAWLDFDGDGWEDLFVANDLNPYRLWKNNGNGTFTDTAVTAGVAYSDLGQVLSGMGVGVRDYNGDAREDLFVTNFSGQMNALFRNEGRGYFTNVTHPSGIGAASLNLLAFGCESLDFDRDGHPDLIVGNGHIYEDMEAYSQGVTYREPKSLLRNRGDGTFEAVTQGVGSLATPRVTRGLAVADIDRDGHLDIAANDQDGNAELLHYTGPDTGHWISLSVRGTRSNPNGYHARISLRAGGRKQFAEVRSGSSYCSHSDAPVYFGLGEMTQVDELEIAWHGSKTVTHARGLIADRAYHVVEGNSPQPLDMPVHGRLR